MKFTTKPLTEPDFPLLQLFYQGLSADTLLRFAPHGCSYEAISNFYLDPMNNGFIAHYKDEVIAYSILRSTFLPQDTIRFDSYGFTMDKRIDATYAPCVADAWRGKGIAGHMLSHIKAYARKSGKTRIFLWGGVQANNFPALLFYRKHGFVEIGSFQHQGENIDMVLL